MKITEKKVDDYTEFTAENTAGLVLCLTSLGAGIREIRVPDKTGASKTVTLCPTDESVYRKAHYGKTVGRTAGRIENATFSIGDKTAVLEKNNHGHDNLHGGASGLHARVFACAYRRQAAYTDVIFTYDSPDGEGGYFGNACITVTYRICENENTFRILFDGTTDTTALLNLTNHVYFNVSGDLCESGREQKLYINASRVGKLNERLLIEKIVPVTAPFDFTQPHKIGDYIDDEQVQRHTHGYDHPYFLHTRNDTELACSLYSEKSGIFLQIRTTYPCVVFYSDSCPHIGMPVSANKTDEPYLAACLECQYDPDGIHRSPANCGVLTAAKPYHAETEYKLTVADAFQSIPS